MYNDEIAYSPSTPPATIGLTYYIGSAAEEAAEVVEDAQSVDDIADTSAHAEGMGDLAQVLEDAGVTPRTWASTKRTPKPTVALTTVPPMRSPQPPRRNSSKRAVWPAPVSGLATVAVLALPALSPPSATEMRNEQDLAHA